MMKKIIAMNIMTPDEVRAEEGFNPFDLEAPSRLIFPVFTPMRSKMEDKFGTDMKTWICDIDGTLAIKGDRSPFDWDRVGEDTPNIPVIRMVRALMLAGDNVVFMSGRMDTGTCRQQTEVWLGIHLLHLDKITLFMRAAEDYRPDEIVKRELYEENVEGNYDIIGVIDDRSKVVRMWRKTLGLTVFDVAGNDF
jgi:hypothetical protein